MSTTSEPGRRRRGRPSRGDRVTITTKIPRAYDEKLHAWVEYRGESITDYVAALITADLDGREVPEVQGQEVLDLKIA